MAVGVEVGCGVEVGVEVGASVGVEVAVGVGLVEGVVVGSVVRVGVAVDGCCAEAERSASNWLAHALPVWLPVAAYSPALETYWSAVKLPRSVNRTVYPPGGAATTCSETAALKSKSVALVVVNVPLLMFGELPVLATLPSTGWVGSIPAYS